MTLPAFILGVALSTLIGAAFHFWRGGGLGRLLLYLVLGWVGFWIGHGTAVYFHFSLGWVGPLNMLAAPFGSILLIGVGFWLSLVEVERR